MLTEKSPNHFGWWFGLILISPCRLRGARRLLLQRDGGEGIEDVLMVVVEPLDFLLGHHLADDGSLVDGTEGERLELEELAEFCLLIRYDQQSVLCAGATTVREIDARFMFRGLSFDTIAGYQAHGAIVHYEATLGLNLFSPLLFPIS